MKEIMMEKNTGEDTPVVIENLPSIYRSTEGLPTVYCSFSQVHLTNYCESTSFEEATNCPEKVKWNETMGKDIKSLKDKNIWKLIYTSWKEGNRVQQVDIQGHE